MSTVAWPSRRFRTLAACLFGGLLGGCGGTSTTVATSSPVGNLEVGLASAFCAWQASCSCPKDAGASLSDAGKLTPEGGAPDGGSPAAGGSGCETSGSGDGGAVSTCLARAELTAAQQLALVETAYEEGLLSVDPVVTDACAAAYRKRACSPSAGVADVASALADPACAGIFTGYIPEGQRCDMTAECVAGTFCLAQATGQNLQSISGAGTLGVCFPYVQLGNPCNTLGDCQPPLVCGKVTFTCEATP